MTAGRRAYRSEVLRSLHRAAADLSAVGAIAEAELDRFATACLAAPREIAPAEIRRICEEAGLSPMRFALALNVLPSTVLQWERGDARPSGRPLKLLLRAVEEGIGAVLKTAP